MLLNDLWQFVSYAPKEGYRAAENFQGRGESQRILQEGLAEAAVLMRRIASYGDPRLYALALATKELAQSSQPLVPERVFMSGDGGHGSEHGLPQQHGLLGVLMQLLVAEKSGFQPTDPLELSSLKTLTDRLAGDALKSLENGQAK